MIVLNPPDIVNALPGIAPTARPYSMGEWPQARIKMRNGRTVRWGLSSIPSGDKMELAWENITYAQAEQIATIWDANYGIYGEVTLPPEIFAGTTGRTTGDPLYVTTLDGKVITTLDGKAITATGPKFSGLTEFMAEPFPGATWHFVGKPQVSSVKARRCTMQIPIGVRGFTRYSA
jgi:hypothetical protein